MTRYAYHYRLTNGDSGTMLTDEATMAGARAKLEATHGDRLATITNGNNPPDKFVAQGNNPPDENMTWQEILTGQQKFGNTKFIAQGNNSPDLLTKLPSMLSSTCESSDVTAVASFCAEKIATRERRVASAARATQQRSQGIQDKIKRALGAVPLNSPMADMIEIVRLRMFDPPSDKTIRKHISLLKQR